jgi:hypothetical protein
MKLSREGKIKIKSENNKEKSVKKNNHGSLKIKTMI